MTFNDYNNKITQINKFERKIQYFLLAIVIILVLFDIILYTIINDKKIAGYIFSLLFCFDAIFTLLLYYQILKNKYKKINFICIHCNSILYKSYSSIIIASKNCPKCGKNIIER
jgi:hypothetical protein